jgi:hypothetical protein
MDVDRERRYESANDFYVLDGSACMRLTPPAAIDVCLQAAQHELIVFRIEGGFWLNPGFESRLDCIWESADPPMDVPRAEANGRNAAEFIREMSDEHDVFIITTVPLEGWRPPA